MKAGDATCSVPDAYPARTKSAPGPSGSASSGGTSCSDDTVEDRSDSSQTTQGVAIRRGTGSSNPSLRNHQSAEGFPQRPDILRVSDTIRDTILDTVMEVPLCSFERRSKWREPTDLQLWRGYWRVRKPVPKLLIPIIGKGQYLTRPFIPRILTRQRGSRRLYWPSSTTSSSRPGCASSARLAVTRP